MSILEKWGFITKIEDSSAEQEIPSLTETLTQIESATEKEDVSQGGSMVDHFTGVQDLYASKQLPLAGKETVYTVDNLIKALPSGLPADLVKVTLQNITQASYMNLEELTADGEARISALEQFGRQFTQHTDEVIAQHEKEIEQLKAKIAEYQTMIEQRNILQAKQMQTLQYEIDRISSILSFVK